jgi:hypothetical protein
VNVRWASVLALLRAIHRSPRTCESLWPANHKKPDEMPRSAEMRLSLAHR